MSRPEVVLVDLDGTITDSIPGIDRCLRLALPVLGMRRSATTTPGLPGTTPSLHPQRGLRGSEEDLGRFVAEYRAQYFGGGEYEFAVFPGMADLVADIAASDRPAGAGDRQADRVGRARITGAGLIDFFDFVSGSKLDSFARASPR